MRQLAYEQAVLGRLTSRPHLIPVFTNALRIPESLREWNPAYYVVLNVVRVLEKLQGLDYHDWTPVPPGVSPRWNAWYEVHKLNAPEWSSEGVILPFGPLDARAVPYVVERDIELTGSLIFDRLEESQRRHQAELEKRRRTLAHDIAVDIRTAARLDYWGSGHFGPRPAFR